MMSLDQAKFMHDKYAKALAWARHKVKVENCVSAMRRVAKVDDQWVIRSRVLRDG